MLLCGDAAILQGIEIWSLSHQTVDIIVEADDAAETERIEQLGSCEQEVVNVETI